MINPYFFVIITIRESGDYMQCINCGKNLDDNYKYCNKCGKYQPLAKSDFKKARRPFFAGLSIVLLVLGLLPLPILLIGVASLMFAGTLVSASLSEIVIHIAKFCFITSGIPLVLSLICKIISK